MEAPECPVCLQVYSQEEAIPRVLSCGHTICQPCLQQLPPHLPNSIRCPECNQVAKYPAQGPSGLPKNIDLLRLIPHSTAPRTCERAASSNSIKNSSDGLFPAFLTDGNYRIWKDWVIPSEVIQVLQDRGESDASLGTATSSWLGLRKNQMVGLWPLFAGGGDSCRSAIRLGYRLRVLKVLDVLSPLEKDELMLLLKASAMDRRLCKLYGLWLNFEGRAFLVGEKFRQEDSKIWDGLRGGYLEKSLGSLVDSGDVMIGFSGLALEICEALMGLHSQGIVLGFVSPLCFKLDEYGHVLIDLSSSLMEKKRIHEAFSGSTVDESKEVEFDNLVERQLFMSPEVFRRLYNGNLGLDSSTSRLNNSSTESDSETSVGYKSDVWSLACMLIKLILGNSFVCQYLSSYYRYGIAASRESIGASADDYNSWINKVVADMTPVCGAKFEELQHMLSKCLDHDLNKRPQVSDVWKCLKPIFDGCGFDDFQMHFQQDNIEWCLVLGHIYSAPRRFDSSPEMKKGPRLEKANPVGLDDLSGLASGSCSSVNFDQTVLEKLDHIVVQQVPDDGAKIVTLKGHLDCITGLAIGGDQLVHLNESILL